MRPVSRLLLLLLAALAACSTGEPAPDPAALLRQAGQAMAALQTVSADVRFTQGKVELEGFALDSATTKVRLPADSDTTFKVKQGDLLVNVRVVMLSGKVFLQLPFTRPQELAAAQAQEIPDLSRLFDQQRGLPAMLGSGHGSRLDSSEKVDNVDSYKVSTTYTADQVAQVLGALRPGGDISATFWIGRSDKLVRRALLTGDFDQAGGKATVDVHVHDFNKPVEIATPAV